MNNSIKATFKGYSAEYWIKQLSLNEHVEGGYYKEYYRSQHLIDCSTTSVHINGNRSFCTGIYFLLKNKQISKLHRIKSDELWHFYLGDPITIVILENGQYREHVLGHNTVDNQLLTLCVPSGLWLGAFHNHNHVDKGYSLVGCTVSPGFDFQDFEIASYEKLIQEYPQHESQIRMMT